MEVMTRHMSRLWMLVLLAAAGTLIFLAWLQYRWISEVSDAERDRLRAHVSDDVKAIAEDLDQPVNRALRALLAGPPEIRAFEDRASSWYENAQDLKLVRAVYAVDGSNLLRFDPQTRRFDEAPWPAELAKLRARLTGALAMRPPQVFVVDASMPAVALIRRRPNQAGPPGERRGPPEGRGPVFGPPEGRGPGRGFGREGEGPPPWMREQRADMQPNSWSIVEFEDSYLKTEFLPALVKKHLREDGAAEGYAVKVVSRDREATEIFSTAPAGLSFASPEATAAALELRVPQGRGPGRPGNGEGGAPAPLLAATEPIWTIEVKHRSGSLENIVAKSRRVNLAVSAATFLFMGGAMAMVLFTTRRAQALAHSQMEFVAGVSHELRTPLSVICSAADNLADGVIQNDQGVRRYGTVIRSEGRRLGNMVEQLLRFAGIQSGNAKYDLQPTSAGVLFDRALQACAPAIESQSCQVERRIAPDVPDIQADATALVHALRNLIENAVVHGGSGKWVGVGATSRNGSVVMTVEDRGPGIAKSEMSRIFEPFYRGRRALDDQVHGFGLGLALAKKIVDAHDGSLTVESGPGGTKFSMRITAVKR